MTTEDPSFASWIGRAEEDHDVIAPAALAAMSVTIDRDDPPPHTGDPLPPGWHWLLFPALARWSQLGPDGHPRRGDFLPPVPLPRRMWGGGRVRIEKPLAVGEAVRKVSTIEDVSAKNGKSGPLVFVRVRHEITGDGGGAMVEEQDIVYRQAAKPGAPPPSRPAPADAQWQRTIHPDPVLLFRYSALTFNGHRIHYDHPYATGVEGYPGLIVHGPLTATLLLDLYRRERPDRTISRFRFRAVGPLFDNAPFTLAGAPEGDGARLWAAADGSLAMEATVEG